MKVCKGFKMKLYSGMSAEYERRHKLLWNEMKDTIHKYGASNYTIFIDKETNILFAYIELEDEEKWNTIGETEICKKWWEYMRDIMDTNSDNSPVSKQLHLAFHLK